MATNRFNYNDKFSLKDQKVGISSTTPEESLDVSSGTLKGVDLQSNTGITTFSTYEGFLNKKTSYTGNVGIETGISGTLSGEIVIGAGLTMTVSAGATSGQGSVASVKVSNTFTPPIGGTADRPTAPQPGTLYYNKDFKTIEYWDGNFWRQVDNTTTSGRALGLGGMASPLTYKVIDYVNISTKGNTIDFGELIAAMRNNGSVSSAIRAFSASGFTPSVANDIDYVAIASGGKCADFGELSTDRVCYNATGSSSTRGIFGGGYGAGGTKNVIDYIEMMTLGNAIDFGDMVLARFNHAGCASPTRTVFTGGTNTGKYIDYVTTSSKGNSKFFGDLTSKQASAMACSNSVRGISIGTDFGMQADYFNIASTGNAHVFGDLKLAQRMGAATASATRGIFAGGYTAPPGGSSTGNQNTIQYFNIQTQGNAADFGDLCIGRVKFDMTTDCHGGLGGF